jgi:hypothetical protein
LHLPFLRLRRLHQHFENIQGQASYNGGVNYEFKKVKGKWKGKAVGGFGSSS